VAIRIIGDGVASRALSQDIRARGMTNIQLIGRRDRGETARLLAASDLLLILLKNKELAEIALPGKTMPYLASGRPIVMAGTGAAAKLILAAKAGVVVDPADPRALADRIVQLSETPRAELDALGAQGALYVRANNSRSEIMGRLEAILESAAVRA
jgi:glycosyltransferase involved in cell wall biosynthesis